EDQLELAAAGRGIDRHDRRVEPRQRQCEDHEVGHIAQHQTDPRALLDPHALKLLGAAVDAVEKPAPRQVIVAIDDCLVVTLGLRGLLQPIVEQGHGTSCPSQSLNGLTLPGGRRRLNAWNWLDLADDPREHNTVGAAPLQKPDEPPAEPGSDADGWALLENL